MLIYQTIIRSIISVSALFFLARLMGKKQIAQLNFFDYTVGISIGSIAAQGAIDPSISITDELVGLIIFTLFSLILTFVSTKSYTGRKVLDGMPIVLIENGKIIEQGLKKTKLTVNDLLEECRQKDVFNVSDIEFGILETSGKLSVLLKSTKRPLTPKDMNISVNQQGLCTNIIIDGKIIQNHLQLINQDEEWLNIELEKQQIENYSNVLLAYVDDKGTLNIIPKNVDTNITSV